MKATKEWLKPFLFSYSVVSNSLRPHGLRHTRLPCPSLSRSLLKLMSIESVMPSNHLILYQPLLSIRVFSNESALHIRWPNYWSFSFSPSPCNEYSGLIPFMIDWFDLLAVQWTPRVFSNTTAQKHPFFGIQPFWWFMSHVTTGKTIALTRRNFDGKVMSLLFNMLSGLVITFLPKSKRLLISWLQSPSAVILEPPKIKSDTVSIVSPSISHELMGPDAMILVFWMLNFSSTDSLVALCFLP